jgi:hypothetical protein
MLVFRFYSDTCGYFGEPLVATIEVIPEPQKQEEKLLELLEGDKEINPILYEIANDLVSEGLGTFDQCLECLLMCKDNYEKAKEMLLAKNT